MTQGLLVALRMAAPRTLLVVFTDNGTKDLRWVIQFISASTTVIRLENEIVRLRTEKMIEVYIVLTPEFEGYFNGKSLPAYGRMGKVTIYIFSQIGLIASKYGGNKFL